MAPPAISYVDLRGYADDYKVALVTGANVGLGYHTSRGLALAGAHVYLACRSEERAQKAIETAGDVSPGRLSFLKLDLSSLAAVHSASAEFLAKESRLDILVNNGAVVGPNFAITTDEIEFSLQTNHIGPMALTLDLLPVLKATAARSDSDVRIVTLSSAMGALPKPQGDVFSTRDNLNVAGGTANGQIGGMTRYSYTKLYNMLFTQKLQEILDAENFDILCVSLHPGMVATDGGIGALPGFPLNLILRPIYRLIALSPEAGAFNSLFCAADVKFLDPAFRKRSKGSYWQVDGIVREKGSYGQGSNEEFAEALWKTSLAMIAGRNVRV